MDNAWHNARQVNKTVVGLVSIYKPTPHIAAHVGQPAKKARFVARVHAREAVQQDRQSATVHAPISSRIHPIVGAVALPVAATRRVRGVYVSISVKHRQQTAMELV
jgi:hypothetical protein